MLGLQDQRYQSWGRFPHANGQNAHVLRWLDEDIDLTSIPKPILPYAYGRSYGDSCLNIKGSLLDTTSLRRFIAFDPESGLLRCEAGISLADILDVLVPRGWFLPVTPGTKYVSLGGAIANDVHGKNHHWAGTFGCHIRSFELLRSTGERFLCSPQTHRELFHATIGGLGLTGLILWAELQMKPIPSRWLQTERIRFSTLDEFFALSTQSDETHEYTVAWIDSLARGRAMGRGLFMRGQHTRATEGAMKATARSRSLTIPCDVPSWMLNPWSMTLFNALYYYKHQRELFRSCEHFDSFFYPLDAIKHWNRLYGRRGFLQYQCVIPPPHERSAITELLGIIQQARQGSFLAVLKKFGEIVSPGLLSFPRAGTTLALDFPYRGSETLALMHQLDQIVRETKGAVYPAKDARMSSEDFKSFFPQWEKFLHFKDPAFSSSFWRRVVPERHTGELESRTSGVLRRQVTRQTCGACSS